MKESEFINILVLIVYGNFQIEGRVILKKLDLIE